MEETVLEGEGQQEGGVGKGRRGCERAAAHLRPAERGWKEGGGAATGGLEGGGRSRGSGRGSDLHKYIEFIEMSLGIAARRILAAYQPPRRFIPSSTLSPPPSPLPLLLSPTSSSSSSLAFIKIAGLIYAAR